MLTRSTKQTVVTADQSAKAEAMVVDSPVKVPGSEFNS